MVGINGCDPELSLRLGSGHHSSTTDSDSTRSSRVRNHQQQQQQQQQITLFYNGRICVSDVTEIQARAIISMAKREMEEGIEKKNPHQLKDSFPPKPTPSSPPAVSQLINPGLSMKRSLQRFLQKRMARMDAASPYSYTPQWRSTSPSQS